MRILTILARFGTEQYPDAEQQIDDLFRRQMPKVDRSVLVVDNALPAEFMERRDRRILIGGDNGSREFSAFDRGVGFVGKDLQRYDFIHLATSAFKMLYVDYLERFNTDLLEAISNDPVCVGHVDCYNEPVGILGFISQHWIRSCFFFLPPIEIQMLGSFVSIPLGDRIFSGNASTPFLANAPLSGTYQKLILEWLTGKDIGQGVSWHSGSALTADSLPSFETKALSIMNEHLLSVRLSAAGCRLIDVTWLTTSLARDGADRVRWATPWYEQLANRDRDAVIVPTRWPERSSVGE